MDNIVTTDFIVVGGGVAGLRAAITASQSGRVILLSKGADNESSSQKAQGGIAAVLNEEEGEIASHYQDTVSAGRGLCREEAVHILVKEGHERIEELIRWGAKFDKIGSKFALALEGVHQKRRVLRAHGDATGLEIVKTLVRQIKKIPNILFLSNYFAVELIVENGTCNGVWVLDEAQGEFYPLLAQGVILATGGAGQLFKRTTNPDVATGDGMAMALRAGAVAEDMEFVQFHPTSLSLPDAPPFLLSEAIRGEGGRLINRDGKRFMTAYHSDGELAPRDIVTRAILNEMRQGQSVFLDSTHLKSPFLRKRFPTIDKTCRTFGIDMTRDPIPVAPAAHYMMGGIKTDLTGKTSINQLWAVGEVAATGVHGANRLASNALLEGLVFGARVSVAKAGANEPQTYVAVGGQGACPITSGEARWGWDEESRRLGEGDQRSDEGDALPSVGAYLLAQKELKEVMWDEVGIIRSNASLDRAGKKLKKMQWVLSKPLANIPAAQLRQVFETRNLLTVAIAVIKAAKMRKESIGAHFMEDAPLESRNPSCHFSFQWDGKNPF